MLTDIQKAMAEKLPIEMLWLVDEFGSVRMFPPGDLERARDELTRRKRMFKVVAHFTLVVDDS